MLSSCFRGTPDADTDTCWCPRKEKAGSGTRPMGSRQNFSHAEFSHTQQQGKEQPRGTGWGLRKSQDVVTAVREAAAGLPLGASCIRNIPTNDRRGRGLLDGLEWKKVGRKDCSQVNNSLVLASQLWHLLNLSLSSIIKAEHAALSDLSENWSLCLVLPTDSWVTSVTSSRSLKVPLSEKDLRMFLQLHWGPPHPTQKMLIIAFHC